MCREILPDGRPARPDTDQQVIDWWRTDEKVCVEGDK